MLIHPLSHSTSSVTLNRVRFFSREILLTSSSMSLSVIFCSNKSRLTSSAFLNYTLRSFSTANRKTSSLAFCNNPKYFKFILVYVSENRDVAASSGTTYVSSCLTLFVFTSIPVFSKLRKIFWSVMLSGFGGVAVFGS